ncbi:hypothetical protein GIS00_06185 [Nakamurella sp. YIM 132087]|uniref:Glyoxalase-like domain-containing protein n=1 Tax=Nakamurella alba TaxID=2665158 RepID=A0A7K1FHD7_9ACTN|nr:VOC family protein [Nakamurella alba]MTD13532.1 hypothetical protein [Nakamurella alba]
MSQHWSIGADANDPQRLAAFWAEALDYVIDPDDCSAESATVLDPEDIRPAIGFLRVPESKSAKNRFHIDIRMAGEPPWDWAARALLIRGRVDALVALGGTEVREEHYTDERGSVLGHVVMLDPEGNEFCVA